MKFSVRQELNKILEKYKWKSIKDVDWYNISYDQELSEEFIREFQDKVHWYNISYYQELSEDFMREFKDKPNWVCISYHQKISEFFVEEFKDKLDLNLLLEKDMITQEFFNSLYKVITRFELMEIE